MVPKLALGYQQKVMLRLVPMPGDQSEQGQSRDNTQTDVCIVLNKGLNMFKERGVYFFLHSNLGAAAKASIYQGKNCVVVEANDETLCNVRRSLEEDNDLAGCDN